MAVDFAIGGAHNVDVAFWDAMAKTFVAFNNDSYNFASDSFTKPGHTLGKGPITAHIRLAGAWVDERFTVTFQINSDGKVEAGP